MTDLSTTYLGLELATPLVVSSSPLCESLDNLRRMEEAGAGAVILPSLFAEQIGADGLALDMGGYNRGPEGYLELVRRAKETIKVPVIASLNGVTPGGWIDHARLIERAGADALELNFYELPTDPAQTGAMVERNLLDLVAALRTEVNIPLAVKLTPQLTAPVAFARELAEVGAQGIVLFNRCYQPDFNVESQQMRPTLYLSTPSELPLRLHWVALMHGRVPADLAVTGGVHEAPDVLKAILAGARVAMMKSALFKHGIEHLSTVKGHLRHWLESHGHPTLRPLQGQMSFQGTPDPWGVERANYMQTLRSFAVRELR